MSLVEQRNRFLSFAFASADILIETDLDGRVSYAAGATAVFGEPSIEEYDGEFATRLDRTSRPILRALSRGLKPGRRAGPARVTIGGRPARLSGWQLGEAEMIRWAVSFEAADAPEELDPQAFERSAGEAIAAARASGEPMGMSVLRLDGVEDLERLIGPDQARILQESVTAAALNTVGDAGIARQVAENRFALIHPGKADLDALKNEVDGILEDFKLDQSEARIETVPDALDLEPEIAVNAFLHAVNQAADNDEVLDVGSLQEVAAEMMADTQRRMNELRTTIAGRVIEPYAQPIIDLNTGEIHHYELLLRLPGGAPVQENVGFAESTGLIFEIDFAMTEIAANFLRDDFDRPALAVNLSGKSLANPNWGRKFLKLISDLKIDRSRLSFELTETANVKNIKAANSVIQKLRERGHKVCLDDFGAGFAGFHYLRDFPADIIKIDGAYIKHATRSDRDSALLRGMVELCRNLGTEVVAEFIESKGSAATVKAMGVTYGQGYYFGKPVPLETLKDPRNNANRAA